ncbi:MAG: alginate export family protein, partial [Elusimicrobia bacterium]|nr:alginate export family protein [Elusimicrobiota bacterium]
IGRQPLVYGNALIVGDGDGTGAVAAVADITGGINFDAVKAVLDYDPLTIDIFAAKANEDINMAQNDDDDTDLYGINANLKVGGDMNVVLEGYLFAKMDRNSTSTAQVETEKVYVPGLRVSLNPYEGLNLQAEAAYQTGSTAANETLGAYAFQTMASFALPVLKDISPVLSASYTYLSGDKNGTGDNNSAWDSMYYDQNAGRIFYNVYSFSDLKLASVALEATPMEDVTAKLSLYSLQEAKGTSNERGNEVDLDVSYAYTEDVTLGVSAGMFNSKVLGQDDTATQLLSSVKVVF